MWETRIDGVLSSTCAWFIFRTLSFGNYWDYWVDVSGCKDKGRLWVDAQYWCQTVLSGDYSETSAYAYLGWLG